MEREYESLNGLLIASNNRKTGANGVCMLIFEWAKVNRLIDSWR